MISLEIDQARRILWALHWYSWFWLGDVWLLAVFSGKT